MVSLDAATNVLRMAYIDSELAKRRQAQPTLSSHNGAMRELSESGALIDAGLHRQPAALGKLHEIDLGPDATLKNIARTEEAKRRLAGGASDEEGIGKVKLRRDGKPYRRKRRNSQDVKRDKLVEEVMKESRRMDPSILKPSRPGLTLLLQWKSTTSPNSSCPMTTKQPTTASPSNSEESSWTRYPRAGSGPARLRRRKRMEPRWMISPGGRSWVGAGARVLR